MPVRTLNFKEEVEELVDDPLISKDGDIAILGGEFKASGGKTLEQVLEGFLKKWDFSRMPYHIWEYMHRIEFTKNLPDSEEYSLLERGHIFGSGGDLDLRRDGERFLWRFIGPKGAPLLSGYGAKDFWAENPDVRLRQHNESALLWGDYKEAFGRWQEDRVGWAELEYPITSQQARKQGERVWIHYTIFTDGGQVAFVWWKELKSHG